MVVKNASLFFALLLICGTRIYSQSPRLQNQFPSLNKDNISLSALQGQLLPRIQRFSKSPPASFSPLIDSDTLETKESEYIVEPILTEETLPNEPGEWDLRLSLDYSRANGEINSAAPRLQLFFGIVENIAGEIGIPFLYRKSGNSVYGLGKISTNLKWLLIRQGSVNPAIVVGVETEFPTGGFKEEGEEEAYEITPYLAFLKTFGRLGLQGNIGRSGEIPVSGNEYSHSVLFNLSLSYPLLNKDIYLLAELNHIRPKESGNTSIVAAGLKFNLDDEHFIALALPVQLNTDYSIFRIIIQYQAEL